MATTPHKFPTGTDGCSLGINAENSLASGSALDVSVDNITARIGRGIVGVPSDLTGTNKRGLWDDSTDDVGLPGRPAGQSMPWPTSWFRSVFRAFRDPAVATDDSSDTIGTQIYNHGWIVAPLLNSYFQDSRYGKHPTQVDSPGR